MPETQLVPVLVSQDYRAKINYEMVEGNTFKPLPSTFDTNGVEDDFSGAILTFLVWNALTNELAVTGAAVATGGSIQLSAALDTQLPGEYEYELKKNISGDKTSIQAGIIFIKSKKPSV